MVYRVDPPSAASTSVIVPVVVETLSFPPGQRRVMLVLQSVLLGDAYHQWGGIQPYRLPVGKMVRTNFEDGLKRKRTL